MMCFSELRGLAVSIAFIIVSSPVDKSIIGTLRSDRARSSLFGEWWKIAKGLCDTKFRRKGECGEFRLSSMGGRPWLEMDGEWKGEEDMLNEE